MFTKSAAFYDAIYSGKDYAREAALVHEQIRAHRRSPGNTLLDVGCGTGHHLDFLRAHYRCEGLDLDAGLLEIARARHPDLAFHQGDMATFRLGRRFDAVTCLFSAIGYVRTGERLRQAVRTLADHLVPGGVLVVEPWFPPDAVESGRVRADVASGEAFHVARMARSYVEGSVSVLDFHYLVGTADGVEHFTERHELGLFTYEETLAAMEACGLEVTYDPTGPGGRGLYVCVGAEGGGAETRHA